VKWNLLRPSFHIFRIKPEVKLKREEQTKNTQQGNLCICLLKTYGPILFLSTIYKLMFHAADFMYPIVLRWVRNNNAPYCRGFDFYGNNNNYAILHCCCCSACYYLQTMDRDRRGRMVVGFTTTCAIQFEPRSWWGVIKFISDLQQVGGFLRVLRFPPPMKLTATI
jgi:hypothetical protein